MSYIALGINNYTDWTQKFVILIKDTSVVKF